MASSFTHSPSTTQPLTIPRLHHRSLKLPKSQNLVPNYNPPRNQICCCTNTSRWEPSPLTYAPDKEDPLLKDTTNIFETIPPSSQPSQSPTTSINPINQQPIFSYLRRPLWLLGPTLLLLTGVVPTLWLPVSSIFLGPNIASLLSLTGLDCVFNLGATLFLLMADSTARPRNGNSGCSSKPPSSYQFWNIAANVVGFIIPLAMLVLSHNGFLQPQLPLVSFAVLLGPYFLLLLVQLITEMLTWHWESPVWLVTPVVYEAYRLLQLMRGLKLGAEVGAPGWMVHTVRGLVCGWVVVVGVQLMRVAWYAGFTARAYQQRSDAPASEGSYESS